MTIGDGTDTRQATTTAYDLGGRVTSVDDGFACTTTTYVFDRLDTVTTGLTGGTCAKSTGDHWREVTHAVGRPRSRDRLSPGPTLRLRRQRRPVSATAHDAQGSILDASSYAAATQTRTGSTFSVNVLGQTYAEEHYHTVSGTRTADATAKSTVDAAGNPTDACFWKAGIATDVCRAAANPPPNPPTTVTSTTYDARNNRIAQTTLSSDGSTLGGTTLYNPDADYQPAAVYTPTTMSGATVLAELQTTYTYETTGPVRRARLVGLVTRACVGPSADHPTCTELDRPRLRHVRVRRERQPEHGHRGQRRGCHDPLVLPRRPQRAAHPAGGRELHERHGSTRRTRTMPRATSPPPRAAASRRRYTYVTQPEIRASILSTTRTLTVTTDSAGLTTGITGGASPGPSLYDPEGRLRLGVPVNRLHGHRVDRVDAAYDGAGHRTQVGPPPTRVGRRP